MIKSLRFLCALAAWLVVSAVAAAQPAGPGDAVPGPAHHAAEPMAGPAHRWKWATDIGLIVQTGHDPLPIAKDRADYQLRTMAQLAV